MSLNKYIAHQNAMSILFRDGSEYPTDKSKLTAVHKKMLADRLSSDMSPEALTCDGELRGPALKAKRKMLEKAIADLAALGEIVVLLD
jgi:hypothetical protein